MHDTAGHITDHHMKFVPLILLLKTMKKMMIELLLVVVC